MVLFIARRIAAGVVLVFVVTAVTFVLIFSGGPNIARNILGADATKAQVAAKAASLGLDQPVYLQYWHWLTAVLHGSLGTSYFSGQSVVSAMASRVPVTLSLVGVSLLLTTVLSVAVGVLSARRGGFWDRLAQIISVFGYALPSYWIALVLVVGVALPFSGIFPATGYTAPSASITAWLACLTLPAVALTIGGVAAVAQQLRGSMLDVLRQDYIRTLRSRGISERAIVYRHGLRNAATPALTVLALHVVTLLGGSIVIERVFALPGLGTLAITASQQGDVPEVMGVVAFMVVVVVLVNLLIDLANGWLNPKARLA
jgi:peptide/nickel transport system permease protein